MSMANSNAEKPERSGVILVHGIEPLVFTDQEKAITPVTSQNRFGKIIVIQDRFFINYFIPPQVVNAAEESILPISQRGTDFLTIRSDVPV